MKEKDFFQCLEEIKTKMKKAKKPTHNFEDDFEDAPIKDDEESIGASFNMAVDSLQRLGELLREIKMISAELNIEEGQRQICKIQLVKQFYIQSSPFLSDTANKKYENAVLHLQPKQIKMVKRSYNGISENAGYKFVYDGFLEFQLDRLVLDISRDLQKEGKYLMPDKSESSNF